jgi:hypothetical protein
VLSSRSAVGAGARCQATAAPAAAKNRDSACPCSAPPGHKHLRLNVGRSAHSDTGATDVRSAWPFNDTSSAGSSREAPRIRLTGTGALFREPYLNGSRSLYGDLPLSTATTCGRERFGSTGWLVSVQQKHQSSQDPLTYSNILARLNEQYEIHRIYARFRVESRGWWAVCRLASCGSVTVLAVVSGNTGRK